MTTPADDAAVEDAFEAYLAGRPVPEEAADLAVFAEAVRTTATAPGRPNAALAELLATGLLTDQSSPSTRTARSAGTPPSRGTSRTRNRRRFAMIFPALLAKLLSAGAVAQAATGAGIVVVVATGAGATGVLGDDVQDTVTGVVASDEETVQDDASDISTDTENEKTATDTGVDPADVEGTEGVESLPVESVDEPAAAAKAWVEYGPTDEYKSFGDWVSSMASNKDMRAELKALDIRFSDVVKKWAHNKGMSDEELESELDGEDAELGEPTETAPESGTEVDQPADDAESEVVSSEPREQGNGKAKGNGGNGNGTAKSNGNGTAKSNGNGTAKSNGNGRN
jgi:hypothetical protein